MDSNGNASANADMKSKFLQVYEHLKAEVLADPAFDYTDDARQWVDKLEEVEELLALLVDLGIVC